MTPRPGFSIKGLEECDRWAFDVARAERVRDFFSECLRHVKGEWAGQPFVLEAWQWEHIIQPLFGWVDRETGLRRFVEAFIGIPRKNGKSIMAAAIALVLLLLDGEAGAEVYSAAGDKKQASIVFAMAKQMVRMSGALSQRVQPYRNSLVFHKTASVYEPISSDVSTKHGFNASAFVADEFHVWPSGELWDVLNTSSGTRAQPLAVTITTAGHDRTSACWDKWAYAMGVATGEIDDDRFLPVIYCAEPDDDWRDPDVWAKANPNLGVSLRVDYLERECRKAQQSPAYENTFRRLHLNQWTEQATRWVPMDDWDACAAAVDESALADRWCCAAVDLSATTDLTSVTYCFPPANDDDVFRFVFRFFIPAANLQPTARGFYHRFAEWMNHGHLIVTPGVAIDYRTVFNTIADDAQRFRIREIAFDPWNATQFAMELESAKFDVVEMRQGYKTMSEPSKRFLEHVRRRKIAHGGHPVARWNVANCAVRMDPSGNVKPDKSKSSARIDGVVTSIMSMARAMVTPKRSVYESRGVRHA